MLTRFTIFLFSLLPAISISQYDVAIDTSDVISEVHLSDLVQNDSIFTYSRTLKRGRTIGVSVGVAAAWGTSIAALSSVWYSGMEKSSFHFFDDSKEWLQMDKSGHLYSSYKIANAMNDLYNWSGVGRNSKYIASGISFGYMLSFEILDGFGKDWGFSWSDVTANSLGVGLFLAQDIVWKSQRFLLKFSYSPTKYATYRPEVLGSSFSERLLKDYNGQTYWLSFTPATFFENTRFPKWICLSVGYSVDAKLNGQQNEFWTSVNGEMQQFLAKRQFLMSLDIDFSRLPIKKPWLKAIVKQFNYLKIPFPTIIFSGGQTTGRWIYF